MSPVTAFPAQSRESSPPAAPPADIQRQTILDYLKAFGLASQLTEAEKLQFIEISQAFGLNPFKREVHVAVYGEGEYRKLSIITGYEVYLKRAERTGRLDGWRAWVEGEGDQMKAVVRIHRKDWTQPFRHEVYWREAVQKKRDGTPTSFWTKQPRFQLKKVAISQGFRLAFPDELGGMPYDASELPDIESAMPTSALLDPGPEKQEYQASASDLAAPEPSSNGQIKFGIPPKVSHAAGSMSSGGLSQMYQDPYPNEDRGQLLERLEAYLAEHTEALTDRHYEWVMDKAHKSMDRAGVLKMLSYSAKVVKNGAVVAGASA